MDETGRPPGRPVPIRLGDLPGHRPCATGSVVRAAGVARAAGARAAVARVRAVVATVLGVAGAGVVRVVVATILGIAWARVRGRSTIPVVLALVVVVDVVTVIV